MSEASWALVTTAELKDILEVTGAGSDDRLDALANLATSICQRETGGRNLKSRTYTSELYSGDGESILLTRNYPITSVTAVSLWGTAQTVGDDPDLYDVQWFATHLFRAGGWWEKANGISLTYVAGYLAGAVDRDGADHDAVLSELKRAAFAIAKDLWQRDKTQRPEVQTIAVQGKSMSFVVDPPIPTIARDILRNYARIGVAA